MNWFVARIVFRILSGPGDHIPQFDEHLKLIQAPDEGVAYQKATLLGKQGQDSFPNSSGENVEWKFIGIPELTKINGLDDGVELHSKIIEEENAFNYIYAIQQKNSAIESRIVSLKKNTIAL
jgi:Domain of unknown function (DUF4288)